MEALPQLLKQSLLEYALVSKALDEIAHRLDTLEPPALLQAVEDLRAIQQQATETDGLVEAALRDYPLDVGTRQLVERRSELLARILEKNRLIFTRSDGMLAVTAAELAEMRKAQAALSGYHSAGNRSSGRVVRRSY